MKHKYVRVYRKHTYFLFIGVPECIFECRSLMLFVKRIGSRLTLKLLGNTIYCLHENQKIALFYMTISAVANPSKNYTITSAFLFFLMIQLTINLSNANGS